MTPMSRYEIEVQGGVAIVRLLVPPTVDDVLAVMQALNALPDATCRLWDLRAGFELGAPELQALAKATARHRPAGARAAVLATDDLAFGLSRMYEAFVGDTSDRFRVFRAREEALSWLRSESADY